MKHLTAFVLLLACAATVRAEIHTEMVDYKQGDTVCEGYLAYDAALSGPRPGVLIIHQWKGLTDYEKKRADMLAKLGYTAFALDIYGKGVRPRNAQEAGAQAGKYRRNRALLRARAQAGLAVLQKDGRTDPKRIAAIGYCFGGTAVIELARSGAEIAGVVSFHGGLDSPHPEDGKNIRCKVLALHGADDPHMSAQELTAFEEEMRQAKVDWQLIKYGGAVHAFTDWGAGNDSKTGAAYNAKADRRSWEAMKLFFAEIFDRNQPNKSR